MLLPVRAVGGDVVERVEDLGLGVDREAERARGSRGSSVCRSSGGPPTTSPSWYTQNDRSRLAVIEASFWRRLPAAALRGLTNSRPPAASACSFSRSKLADRQVHLAAHLEHVGHRRRRFGAAARSGTTAIVATLAVTSSPTRPSPRVAACT